MTWGRGRSWSIGRDAWSPSTGGRRRKGSNQELNLSFYKMSSNISRVLQSKNSRETFSERLRGEDNVLFEACGPLNLHSDGCEQA